TSAYGSEGWGFESLQARQCDVSGHRNSPDLRLCRFGLLLCGSWWSAGGLVVAVRVDGQVAQGFSGGGVDDGDVEVLDEQDDVGSGVGSSDADVAEAAGDAEGDAAGFVDLVAADSVVGVGGAVAAGGGLR